VFNYTIKIVVTGVAVLFFISGCHNIIGDIEKDIYFNSGKSPEFRLMSGISGSIQVIASGDTVVLPDTYTESIRIVSLELWNDGDEDLHLTSSNLVELSNTEDFSLVAPYPSTPVSPGSSEVIYISFSTDSAGLKSATVSIPNNDNNESSFQLVMEATVVTNPSPGTPLNVSAANGISTDSVEVQWDGVPDADLHVVYRTESSTPPADENDYLELSSSTSYTDSSAVPGRKYYYWVSAWMESTGFGSISEYATGYRKLSIPSLPLYTGATDSTSTVSTDINWEDVQGDVSQYYIYRNTMPQISGASVMISASSNYSDTDAMPGSLYYYAVKAYSADTDSFSDLSVWEEGARRLSPPELLSVSNGTATDYVETSWSVPSGNVSSYSVIRRAAETGAGDGFESSATPYQDTTAFPGRVLYYTVKAYSAETDSYSEESNQLNGYRALVGDSWYFEASQGEHPTGESDGPFAYDPAIPSRIYLSWWNKYTDSFGTNYEDYADSYRIYRSASENGVYSLVSGDLDPAGQEIINFTDYPPQDGVSYFYKLQVYSSSSDSYSDLSDSTVVSGFAILDGVQNLSAEQHSSGGILLSFDTVSDAERYYIYRTQSLTLFPYWDIIGYTTTGTYHDLTAPLDTRSYYHVRTWSSDPLHYGYLAEGSAINIYNE